MPDLSRDPDLTSDDVRKVARLSKLTLTDSEIDAERTRLSAVLGYVARLRSLDLEGVEPMPRASDEPARLREDTPSDHLPPETLAKIAPSPDAIAETHDAEGRTQRHIRVPKVLGEGGA